jgi:hypothetical protein
VYIGYDGGSNPVRFFKGGLDEVKIYNRALTPNQIQQRYQEGMNSITTTSKIMPSELKAGDTWSCQVTPNDGFGDGVSATSNSVTLTQGTNSNPVVNYNLAWGYPGGLLTPGGSIATGSTVRMYTGVSDLETASNLLTVQISYKPHSSGSWTTITSTTWLSLYGGYWYYDWVIPGSATLGSYDVKVDVSDPSGGSASNTVSNSFTVVNSNPVVNYNLAWGYPGGLLTPGGSIATGSTVRMYTGVSDLETASNLLTVQISYKPHSSGSWTTITSTTWLSLYGGYWYYDWVIPGSATLGSYDVKVDVSDPSGGSASNTVSNSFTVTLI